MIEKDDLRAAVSAGAITEAQAARILTLAAERQGHLAATRPDEEPFELFKGFNEIFIVVGLVILAAGWVGVSAAIGWVDAGTGFFDVQGFVVTRSLIAAGILWALSEYFIRRRRMVAPAITLTIFWALNAALGFTASYAQPFMVAQQDWSSTIFPLALASVALLIYWLRFRVPFALALVAVGLFILMVVALAVQAGDPGDLSDLFLLSAEGPFALGTLLFGVAVFAVAMWFDMSDPHRVTRRASNGFWLHIVAAPAIVNTIALTLITSDAPGARGLLIAFLALIALVAIVIDRRSFLIAAVGYVVALSTQLDEGMGIAMTILILGVVLLLLGAFWERIRAALMALLPFLPRGKLPPVG
ncbi:hypothetical protein AADZ90_000890 [Aestuariibius sp. 2305UL40-4]|uniref:hypothetical protein n=1 Tax=Aestuariibius violaceus TaxID=3234132 RepID=UPI00345E6107